MTTATELWEQAAVFLRGEISEGAWHSTFASVTALRLSDNKLVLSVPNTIIREKLDGRYRPLVENAVSEAAKEPTTIQFEIPLPTLFDVDQVPDQPGMIPEANEKRAAQAGSAFPPTGETSPSATTHYDPTFPEHTPTQQHQPSPRAPNPQSPLPPPLLQRSYNFDGFVIGPSNRFAHAAALSVAERPGGSYNPLFIYGGAGLGKTHLLQAIEHYVNDVYPQMKVKYISTETFLNEFVDSIKNSSGAAFKRQYRQIDVLLVDDIQFIAGKDGLQEEFFHTFNELYTAQKQIVLSSDRPPDAIPTLEDRLRSRFMMGLLTDIQPPDIETRMAILHKKADRDGYFLPTEVSEFIATNITTNIRELEGALNKVTAFANLNQEPMTSALSERILRDFIADRQPRPITVPMILTATSEHFSFSVEELTGKSRRRPLVIARQIAMYVSRDLTDLSFPMIAREFGGRDHTTVMHACDKIAALMNERSQIYDQVMALDKTVRGQARAV